MLLLHPEEFRINDFLPELYLWIICEINFWILLVG